jgi:hypothetical protein
MSMRAPKLTEVTHKQRLLREEPPLLRMLKIMPWRRQMHRRRLSRRKLPLLQKCECLRADLFPNRGGFVKPK